MVTPFAIFGSALGAGWGSVTVGCGVVAGGVVGCGFFSGVGSSNRAMTRISSSATAMQPKVTIFFCCADLLLREVV